MISFTLLLVKENVLASPCIYNENGFVILPVNQIISSVPDDVAPIAIAMGTPGDKASIEKVVKTESQSPLEQQPPPTPPPPLPLPPPPISNLTTPDLSLAHPLPGTLTTDMGVINRPQFDTFVSGSAMGHIGSGPDAFQQIGLEQATIEDYFTQTKYYPDYQPPVYSSLPSKPKTFLSDLEQPGPSGLQTPKTKSLAVSGLEKLKKTHKPSEEQISTPPTKKLHQCPHCQKCFASFEKLGKHQQTHTGTSPFKCENCKKGFTTKFKLVRHALIHSDRKPFGCSVCDRTFHRKDHLKNHIKVHSPQKQVYICECCKKQYTSLLSYRKHLAVHSAEDGNLICQICQESFDTKDDILYHLKIHAGSRTVKNPNERKFTCDYCDSKFYTKKDVRRHLVVHTGKRDFLCQYCPQRFGRKDHLVRHIKKSHNTKYKPEETVTTATIKTEIDTSNIEPTPIKTELPESGLSKTPETYNPDLLIFEDDLTSLLEVSEEGELKDLGSAILEEIEGPVAASAVLVGENSNASHGGLGDVVLNDPELLQRFLEEPGDKNLPLPGFSQTFQLPPPPPPGPAQ
ncbi:hypothetical protein JTB14_020837 [Gonioctena quinquepunctata]|nr:hypothetical protein JTB14_020837 [Gonioctena quinquepunctata]